MAAKKKSAVRADKAQLEPFDTQNQEHLKIFTRFMKWNQMPETRRLYEEALRGEREGHQFEATEILRLERLAKDAEGCEKPLVGADTFRDLIGARLARWVEAGNHRNFRSLADLIATPKHPKHKEIISKSVTTLRLRSLLLAVKAFVLGTTRIREGRAVVERYIPNRAALKEIVESMIGEEKGKVFVFESTHWTRLLKSAGLEWVE